MTGAANPAEYRQFAVRISEIEDALRRLNNRDMLQNASIGANGLIVYGGGSIFINDGGSLIVNGTGSITLPTGTLTAGTLSITGNGTISGGLTVGSINYGTASGGSLTVTGTITATSDIGASGNVTASGQVVSTGILQSPGSYGYQVTTGYVAAWINNDGKIGFSPSTRATKKNLQTLAGRSALSQIATPYLGHYLTDEDTDPLKVFLLAEEIQAAGYGPDLVPLNENGELFTLNYSQVVVPLLQDIKNLYAEIDALKLRLPPI